MGNSFFDTIHHIREYEEALIFVDIYQVDDDKSAVIDYLEQAFENESKEYPYSPPTFDSSAALWGAKILYFSSQLLLNRKNMKQPLEDYISAFCGEKNASSVLSADLCLRFMPDIFKQSKLIDPDDQLNELLEEVLCDWHYSGIRRDPLSIALDMSLYQENKCLNQLYIDRVIDKGAQAYFELLDIK